MGERVKIVYTLKRARVGRAIEYADLDTVLKKLWEVLEDREKSGFLGKVWFTMEARRETQ
jgi:hypothetical protein